MQHQLQHVHSHQPETFSYSLDWRFLLPIADAGKFCVVVENDTELNQALQKAGIPVSNPLSLLNSQQNENNTPSLVLPFGLPVRGVSVKQADQVEFYRFTRRLMGPNGYLLVGFNNFWNFRSNTRSSYHFSTPSRIVYQLHLAGFTSIKIFGVVPNLSIPEYIFDLNTQALHFALHYRFRRKPAGLTLLRALARTLGPARIWNYLPCYFAVAVV